MLYVTDGPPKVCFLAQEMGTGRFTPDALSGQTCLFVRQPLIARGNAVKQA